MTVSEIVSSREDLHASAIREATEVTGVDWSAVMNGTLIDLNWIECGPVRLRLPEKAGDDYLAEMRPVTDEAANVTFTAAGQTIADALSALAKKTRLILQPTIDATKFLERVARVRKGKRKRGMRLYMDWYDTNVRDT